MKFVGTCQMLGDKSIAHRALILSSWFQGVHTIDNFPNNKDILTTLKALKEFGLNCKLEGNVLSVDSRKFVFKQASVNCNDSGTSARLLCGYLSGVNIETNLFGSKGLSSRPMNRIVDPLNSFGRNIHSNQGLLPIHIKPSLNLQSFNYKLNIPSAQVKASLILHAMFMDGVSIISGQINTRDHLEILLKHFGYPIRITNQKIKITGIKRMIKNLAIKLPGDVSSASFIVAGAVLLKGSSIKIKNICFNKYRIGFLNKLIDMGANITFNNQKNNSGEVVADIHVKYSPYLTGITIAKDEVPFMIDEIPILCVVASYANGESIINGIEELKIKESNRVEAILFNIKKMGGEAKVRGDSLLIRPKNKLHNTTINSFNDHRIFMAFYISNLVSGGKFREELTDFSYKKSFINFFEILKQVIQ